MRNAPLQQNAGKHGDDAGRRRQRRPADRHGEPRHGRLEDKPPRPTRSCPTTPPRSCKDRLEIPNRPQQGQPGSARVIKANLSSNRARVSKTSQGQDGQDGQAQNGEQPGQQPGERRRRRESRGHDARRNAKDALRAGCWRAKQGRAARIGHRGRGRRRCNVSTRPLRAMEEARGHAGERRLAGAPSTRNPMRLEAHARGDDRPGRPCAAKDQFAAKQAGQGNGGRPTPRPIASFRTRWGGSGQIPLPSGPTGDGRPEEAFRRRAVAGGIAPPPRRTGPPRDRARLPAQVAGPVLKSGGVSEPSWRVAGQQPEPESSSSSARR